MHCRFNILLYCWQNHSLYLSISFPILLSFSRVLVHCHPSSPATGAYSFLKSEMGFYACAVWCVHRHRTSCFKSHLRSKSLTQGDCSRMSAGSGNRTSAPVQALDHKSNSLPLGHCAWRMYVYISQHFGIPLVTAV